MQIIKIIPHGFCAGVKYALDLVQKALDDDSLKPIYLLGDVIHNKEVMEKLKAKGAIIVHGNNRFDMLDDIDFGTVIFSAHGVSPRVYQKAKNKKLNIIDATCPNVKVVHNKILNKLSLGYDILYVGVKKHPESEGVIEIDDSIHLITNIDEVDNLDIKNNKIYVTNQTTLSYLDIEEIYKKIQQKYPTAIIDDKICNATTQRQKAVLTSDIDFLIVVGDTLSSNSKKLSYVAKKYNKIDSILIEKKEDLYNVDLKKYNKIGLTSGASTPEDLYLDVYEYLSRM